MEILFWTQNESPEKKNTLILHGDKSDYSGTIEQDNAMKILMMNEMLMSYKPSTIERYIKDQNTSQGLKVMSNKNGTLIHALHQEKDVAGRYMPYALWISSTDSSEVISTIKDYCSQCGKTPFDGDLKVVRNYLESKKKGFGYLLIGISITIIIIILWMILF